MSLLSIKNLPSDLDILSLLIAKKQGRLREKQIQKGALKRKQTRCTNYLQLSHNKRRCVAQPAQNRRTERARNWDVLSSKSNSELERELAPFVERQGIMSLSCQTYRALMLSLGQHYYQCHHCQYHQRCNYGLREHGKCQ
jgi:hypothetical protein